MIRTKANRRLVDMAEAAAEFARSEGWVNDQPETLLGHPVKPVEDMPIGEYPIIFGDLSAYIIHRKLYTRGFSALLALLEEYAQRGWKIGHIVRIVRGFRIPLPIWPFRLLLALKRHRTRRRDV